MKRIKVLLLFSFLITGSIYVYALDCDEDADCQEQTIGQCTCEGKKVQGECHFDQQKKECCVCPA